MNFRHTQRQQKGNALFLVLIAILLFAALGVAATKTSTNTPNSDTYEATIEAQRLLKWLSGVKAAVNTMILVKGTTETSISFEDPRENQSGAPGDTTNTQNPNSRGEIDEVFADMVNWVDFRYLTLDKSPYRMLRNPFFSGSHIAEDIGTGEADLIFFLTDIDIDLCVAINKLAGFGITNSTMPTDTTIDVAHFKGAYGTDTLNNIGGKPFGCFLKDAPTNRYFMYFVILER